MQDETGSAATKAYVETTYRVAPGTETLIDEGNNGYIHTLQHAKKGDGHILLVPQPSLTDPNDPLRWPTWKKWLVFANGLFYSFIGSNIGPIMSGGMVQQSEYFGIPLTHLSWAAGISLLMSGVATLFWIPLSVKYGRRPVFLASSFTMALGCIWCGVAAKTTFSSFFVGRAFVGFFAGPIEAIVPSTIVDIFFLHDRGEKISIYGLSVLGGNEIGPVLSAYIIQGAGMRWAFYFVAIASFGSFISMFFTMPESAFYGARASTHLIGITPPQPAQERTSDATLEKTAQTNTEIPSSFYTEASTDAIPKLTYLQTLKPWSVTNPYVSLKKSFLRPFVLLAYPIVVWASVIYGMALAWNVVLALTIAQLFAPPPYLFGSGAQGLVFLSPFIGSLVGTYLCGPLADQIATYYTKRNNGIREPEMRLPVAIIAAFFTFAGVSIAAPCYANKTHWIGPVFGFGVLSVGSQMGAILSMSYAIDSHKELSGELMITVSATKSAIAWAFSWFINNWIDSNGMMDVYFTIAVLNVVVYASTLLFYYKGKAFRIMIQEKNLFERLGLA